MIQRLSGVSPSLRRQVLKVSNCVGRLRIYFSSGGMHHGPDCSAGGGGRDGPAVWRIGISISKTRGWSGEQDGTSRVTTTTLHDALKSFLDRALLADEQETAALAVGEVESGAIDVREAPAAQAVEEQTVALTAVVKQDDQRVLQLAIR